MRKFLAVAAGLTLASGVIAAAAGSGQTPGEKPKQKVITRTESPAAWVSDDGLPGDEAPMARRLAARRRSPRRPGSQIGRASCRERV